MELRINGTQEFMGKSIKIIEGGFGEKIARFYGDSDVKVLNYGVKKELLDRYDIEELLKKNHLTVQQIVGDLKF